MKDLSGFTGLYPVSKTLRFELIPQGETLSNIEKNGILEADRKLAEDYKKMKKTIDEYHKSFIDCCLSGATLPGLDEFYALYTASADEKRKDSFKKSFSDVKESLRKEITACFKRDPMFKQLDKKELIQQELEKWIEDNNPDLFFSEDFRNFTTYFTGYNMNRMNMYSDEEKATAVAYRLINENLPKFIDNIHVFRKISATDLRDSFRDILRDMEAYINYRSLDDIFRIEAYSDFLTQAQIDAYNTLIGGIKEGDAKKKGLNEYINLYNQRHPGEKLPRFTALFKQILSDRMSASWLPQQFESADDLCEALCGFYSENLGSGILFEELRSVLEQIPERDADGIFIRNDGSISALSVQLFGYYSVIKDALEYYYETVVIPDYSKRLMEAKTDTAREKLEKEKKAFLSDPSFLSVALIRNALAAYIPTLDEAEYKTVHAAYSEDCIPEYYKTCLSPISVAEAYGSIAETVNLDHREDYSFTQAEKDGIKAFLDAVLSQLHAVKSLYVPADSDLNKDAVFYGAFSPLYEQLSEITRLYDMTRNYMIRKPFSTEKIKLNFNCSTLLDGWDQNKERDNLGALFLKDGEYYLGILNKSNNKLFDELEECESGECYRKVIYKLLPGPNKMLPKVFFSKSRIDEFAPSEEILRIREKGTFKKGPDFSIEDCRKFIDFFKASIEKHPEWKNYGFRFSPTESYEDISGFYREVSDQGYKITYKSVSAAAIDELVKNGKLYLFKIYSKDFSPYSRGKKNLHTLYWNALFDSRNLQDVVYKLNGQAEVFFRKASIKDSERTVHPAGRPVGKKNPSLEGEASLFPYDIVKDRRYTVDKFQFHVPVTMNFKAQGGIRLNEKVCAYLKDNPDVNIIGIDRGERHLLYISMIDRNGHVVTGKDGKPIQYSLNTITGTYRNSDGNAVAFTTPYRELLDRKEKERESARENWGTIENIKELKAGYLSQVAYHIAKLMVEYNAIVVLEDLNSGFKNSRVKVEKQVYQNFEKALIEKLNYLVFKDADAEECGGLYHALQLTDQFRSFRELRKQSGFIFYVPAWNTSKIDPVTGFVDLLKPKYRNIPDAKAFFSRFEGIRYNPERDWFEFSFNYSDFTEKAEGTRSAWTACSHGNLRYSFNRSLNNNRGGYEKHNVTEVLKKLFERYGIGYENGEDLREAISAQTTSDFFFRIIKELQILLAMRYSCPEDGKDFILSPVADENGKFFNSDEQVLGLPQDADANGAYNIARKGLHVLRQIDRAEKYGDWTTAISNKEWLRFVQGLE